MTDPPQFHMTKLGGSANCGILHHQPPFNFSTMESSPVGSRWWVTLFMDWFTVMAACWQCSTVGVCLSLLSSDAWRWQWHQVPVSCHPHTNATVCTVHLLHAGRPCTCPCQELQSVTISTGEITRWEWIFWHHAHRAPPSDWVRTSCWLLDYSSAHVQHGALCLCKSASGGKLEREWSGLKTVRGTLPCLLCAQRCGAPWFSYWRLVHVQRRHVFNLLLRHARFYSALNYWAL